MKKDSTDKKRLLRATDRLTRPPRLKSIVHHKAVKPVAKKARRKRKK